MSLVSIYIEQRTLEHLMKQNFHLPIVGAQGVDSMAMQSGNDNNTHPDQLQVDKLSMLAVIKEKLMTINIKSD